MKKKSIIQISHYKNKQISDILTLNEIKMGNYRKPLHSKFKFYYLLIFILLGFQFTIN